MSCKKSFTEKKPLLTTIIRAKQLALLLFLFGNLSSFSQIAKHTKALEQAKIFTTSSGVKIAVADNVSDSASYFLLCSKARPHLRERNKGVEFIIPDIWESGSQNISDSAFQSIKKRNVIKVSAEQNKIFISQKAPNPDTALYLLADIFFSPAFDKDRFIRIRQKRMQSLFPPGISPNLYISNIARNSYYGSEHPRGEQLDKNTLKRISLQQAKRYYENHYIGAPMYIAVITPEQPDSIFALADSLFRDYKPNEISRPEFEATKLKKHSRIYFHEVPDTITGDATYLSLMYEMNENTDEDLAPAAAMMQTALGAYKSGRLFKRIIADDQLAETVFTNFSDKEFNFTAVFKPTNLDKLIKAYEDEIRKFKQNEISQAELDVARGILKDNFIESLKNPKLRLLMLCRILKEERSPDFYSNYLQELEKISPRDIKKTARSFLQAEPYVCAVLGKEREVKNEFYAVAESAETVIMRDQKEFEIIPYGFSVKNIIVKYLEEVNPVEPKRGQRMLLKGVYDFGTNKMTVSQEIFRHKNRYRKNSTLIREDGQKIPINTEIRTGNRIVFIENADTTEILSADFHGIITRSYGFPELEYDYKNITVEFIELQTRNNGDEVYKVKIKYPYELIRYDYFSKKTKLKFKSEFYKLNQYDKEEHIQTIEIWDYKKIPKTKNSKIPYKKRIITSDYTAEFELLKIDYSARIKKDVFLISKP